MKWTVTLRNHRDHAISTEADTELDAVKQVVAGFMKDDEDKAVISRCDSFSKIEALCLIIGLNIVNIKKEDNASNCSAP